MAKTGLGGKCIALNKHISKEGNEINKFSMQLKKLEKEQQTILRSQKQGNNFKNA